MIASVSKGALDVHLIVSKKAWAKFAVGFEPEKEIGSPPAIPTPSDQPETSPSSRFTGSYRA